MPTTAIPALGAWRSTVLLAALALAATVGCGGDGGEQEPPAVAATMALVSPAFADGEAIPREFTCDGIDVSPALGWSGAPPGTAGFALIVDDPDAGSFVHWLVYDIPPGAAGLDRAVSPGGQLPGAAKEGRNSFGRAGYGGPCPPEGKAHHYSFRVYALDTPLNLETGATKKSIEQAMKGHILAEGRLTGTYERQ